MRKYLLSFSVFTIFLFTVFTVPIFAAGTTTVECQPIYGGGQTCPQAPNIAINKQVKNLQTGSFVDNLNVNDPKFSPNQNVSFKIILTNTGNVNMASVNIRDIFPQFVNFTSGPGSFDTNTKTLSFTVSNLNVNESRTFDVSGQVISSDQLPNDKGIVCVVNQAIATVSTNGQQTSQDNSEFCIQKQVLAETTKGGLKVFPQPQVVTTPSTGPEAWALLALLPSGVLGFLLRKRSIKK